MSTAESTKRKPGPDNNENNKCKIISDTRNLLKRKREKELEDM